jgi:hypothetical protein
LRSYVAGLVVDQDAKWRGGQTGAPSISPLALLLCRDTSRQLPINCLRTDELEAAGSFEDVVCAVLTLQSCKKSNPINTMRLIVEIF